LGARAVPEPAPLDDSEQARHLGSSSDEDSQFAFKESEIEMLQRMASQLRTPRDVKRYVIALRVAWALFKAHPLQRDLPDAFYGLTIALAIVTMRPDLQSSFQQVLERSSDQGEFFHGLEAGPVGKGLGAPFLRTLQSADFDLGALKATWPFAIRHSFFPPPARTGINY
jgi:hypothetical protein